MTQTQTERDYVFNFKFTRPDEDNAHTYHIGSHVIADNFREAKQILRLRNSHLTLLEESIELVALFEDGETVCIAASVKEAK